MEDSKAIHRSRLQTLLRATLPEERAAWSAALRLRLKESELWKGAKTVMLFAALRYEPDLVPLMTEGRLCVFPSMEDDRIVPRAVSSAEELIPGPFGIRGPDLSRCPVASVESLDLILIPGLGFSSDGHRLGRGRGHYDRFLTALPAKALRCGVCFACQVSPELPVEAHDIPMQYLLTETGLKDCGVTSGLPGKRFPA